MKALIYFFLEDLELLTSEVLSKINRVANEWITHVTFYSVYTPTHLYTNYAYIPHVFFEENYSDISAYNDALKKIKF